MNLWLPQTNDTCRAYQKFHLNSILSLSVLTFFPGRECIKKIRPGVLPPVLFLIKIKQQTAEEELRNQMEIELNLECSLFFLSERLRCPFPHISCYCVCIISNDGLTEKAELTEGCATSVLYAIGYHNPSNGS